MNEETNTIKKQNTPKSYQPIEVRAMPRKQVKAFRNAGLDPAINPDALTSAKIIEMVDYIIDTVYGDISDQTENLEFFQLRDLAMDTYMRASIGPESIKN